MRTTKAVAVALSMVVLTACGSPKESVPEVASVQAPGSAAAAPAAPAAPVIRPDTTFDEVARMQQPWMKCLREQGIPMRTTENGLLDIGGTGNTAAGNGRIQSRDPKIVEACGKLMPVLAPELDEDKNPYWADDDENYNKCLVAGGSKLVKKDGKWVPGPGWNDQAPNEALELSCQAKSYDGKKG
jgi:hypothetical protein